MTRAEYLKRIELRIFRTLCVSGFVTACFFIAALYSSPWWLLGAIPSAAILISPIPMALGVIMVGHVESLPSNCTECEPSRPRSRRTIYESIRAIRDAGGFDWDSVSDP